MPWHRFSKNRQVDACHRHPKAIGEMDPSRVMIIIESPRPSKASCRLVVGYIARLASVCLPSVVRVVVVAQDPSSETLL